MAFCFTVEAQEVYRLTLDDYQYVENIDGGMGSFLKFPKTYSTVIMGGLNDLDGMNNYFNIFGSKLIVHSLNKNIDGTQKVVLRREDGKNFLGIFPKISASLIPLIHSEMEKEIGQETNAE